MDHARININDSQIEEPLDPVAEDEDNPQMRIVDQNVERLQLINLKLRNRIKDLNAVVERALERQSSKITAAHRSPVNKPSNFDPEHMLRIREKEITNSKKQIETNKNAIGKLKQKLQVLGPTGIRDEDGNPMSWESKYQQQLDLKAKLEKSIKQLEKQNSVQGNAIEKATNSEDHQQKLKTLNEDLRVWKQKVTTLAAQLERERQTRKDQDDKLKQIQEENTRVQEEIENVKKRQAESGPTEEQKKKIEERVQAEKEAFEK